MNTLLKHPRLAIAAATLALLAATLTLNSHTLGALIMGNQSAKNTTGLIGHWTFDGPDMAFEHATDKALDISGSGNSANFDTNHVTPVDGAIGQALHFDGTSWKRITLNSMNNLEMGTGDMTISGWVDIDSASGGAETFVFGKKSSWNAEGYALYYAPGGPAIVNRTCNESSVCEHHGTTQDLTDKGWNMVTAVLDRDAGTSFYLNGEFLEKVGTSILDGADITNGTGAVMGSWDGAIPIASIDDVRVYNRALSAAEIYDLYWETGGKVQSSSSKIDSLTKGLVGYWPLDDGSGTTATDASANGNNGTLTNMEEADWVDGQMKKGLEFDGVDEFVSIPDNTSLHLNDMTVGFWTYANSTPSNTVGLLAKRDSFATMDWELYKASDDTLRLGVGESGADLNIAFGATLPDTTWTHIAFKKTGNTYELFMNGKSVGTDTSTATWTESDDIAIGAIQTDGTSPYDGLIDDVRIYNRALSADEIGLLYRQTGPTTTETGLVSHWTFDGQDMDWSDTSAEVKDVSGSGNHLDVDSADHISVVGKAGQALRFLGNPWSNIWLGSSTNLEMGTGDMTISSWVDIDSASTDEIYIISKKSGWNGEGYEIYYPPSTQELVTRVCNEGGSCNSYAVSVSPLEDTGWHLVTTVLDRDSGVLYYIDGILVGTSGTDVFNGSDITDSGTGVSIGSSDGGTPVASYDDIRVYNRALSADEIYDLYRKTGGTAKASSSKTDPLAKGLVGYWPLDDGSGTTATDASLNANNGTLNNMDAATDWVSGRIKKSLRFDGTWDQRLQIASNADLDAPTGKGTWALWFRGDGSWESGNGGDAALMTRSSSNCNNNGIQFIIDQSGQLMTAMRNGDCLGGDCVISHTDLALLDNSWHHAALIFDKTAAATLYIDGSEVGSCTGATWDFAGAPLYLADMACSTCAEEFAGDIDDVRIYDRKLSAAEVDLLYRQTAPTELETGLIGHWTFDGQDMDWSDASAEVKDAVGGTDGDAINLTKADVIVGKEGQAIRLEDSQSEYIDAGDIEALDNASQFTLAAWMKRSAVGAPVFIAKGSGAASYFGINLWTDGRLYFDLWNGTSGKWARLNDINDTEWHHITIVFDGTQSTDEQKLKVYMDGQSTVPAYTGSIPTTTGDTTGSFLIGRSEQVPGTNSSGDIDDVRIYNRALSATEVEDLYLQGK